MNCPYNVKVCTKCGRILIACEMNFAKQKNGKYGFKSRCRKCDKKYYEENKKQILEHNKQYHEEHKEEIAEYQKQYREEHREHYTEYQKQYYKENKEELAEYKKRYYEEHIKNK